MAPFVVLEGPNGVGKSTQIKLLFDYLTRVKGRQVVLVQEPGSTPLGLKIRETLLHQYKNPEDHIHPTAQIGLFIAARAQLALTVIAPALDADKVVLADRWVQSTIAYQGMAFRAGVEIEDIRTISDILCHGIRPTHNIVLNMSAEECLHRRVAMTGDKDDRFEAEGLYFQKALVKAYEIMADTFPRHEAVNANATPDQVHARILVALAKLDRERVEGTPSLNLA
jgi:dTMP kinase